MLLICPLVFGSLYATQEEDDEIEVAHIGPRGEESYVPGEIEDVTQVPELDEDILYYDFDEDFRDD